MKTAAAAQAFDLIVFELEYDPDDGYAAPVFRDAPLTPASHGGCEFVRWRGEAALEVLRAMVARRGQYVLAQYDDFFVAIWSDKRNIREMYEAAAPAMSAREHLALRSKIEGVK